MARKVIVDVDTGVDDALALLLAVQSPELEVVAVTCVAGNVTIDHVTRNTLATLELAACDAPVAVGARKPLTGPLRTATYFHGANGLGDIELVSPTRAPVDEDGPALMARLTREHPGDITIVALGPMTNLALAILRDAEFSRNVSALVLMGGAVHHAGNATLAAEANFSNDPEAASAVVHSGAPIQLVDLGATSQAILPLARASLNSRRPLSPIGDFALQLLSFYTPICVSAGAAGAVLHDPLAVALAAVPSLARFIPLLLEVETGGTYSRGATIGSFSGLSTRMEAVGDRLDATGLEPARFNASVAREIDVTGFLELFLERLELS